MNDRTRKGNRIRLIRRVSFQETVSADDASTWLLFMISAAKTLVELLGARDLVCATAESCTGGGVASAITAVPGSSAVFAGGVVSYANEVKRDVLGVKEETLARFGAVSAETAEQMAAGALSLMKCVLAVSLTGIAGPGGGSAEKPVGLVWFGLADGTGVRTEKAIFTGEREEVRRKAVVHALGMLTVAAVGGGK